MNTCRLYRGNALSVNHPESIKEALIGGVAPPQEVI